MLKWNCLGFEEYSFDDWSLTAVQPDHIELIRIWRNEQSDVLRQVKPLDRKDQENYYTQHIWNSLQSPCPKNILLSFLRNKSLVGYGGLVYIDWPSRRTELSFLLETSRARNKQQYKEAFESFIKLISDVASEPLGLRKIWTETYSFRSDHISILEANGFYKEGILKDHTYYNGRYIDSILHARFL